MSFPLIDAPTGTVVLLLLGLIIGSFLNVVIHRLPLMLERAWAAHGDASAEGPVFNLSHPASHCPACHTPIAWRHNIPVLSYAWLRGRCAHCGVRVALRYPLVELGTALLFAWTGWRSGGLNGPALAWCGWAAALLTLACIDWDTTLLPDEITLPLSWAGLLAASLGWTPVSLHDAVWGAVAGYLVLWSVYWLFLVVTGKEGMGHGDFKLLAALGAWLGWQALLPIVLLASCAGSVVGLWMRGRQQLREGGYLPFGPFLVIAGWVTTQFRTPLIHWWLP